MKPGPCGDVGIHSRGQRYPFKLLFQSYKRRLAIHPRPLSYPKRGRPELNRHLLFIGSSGRFDPQHLFSVSSENLILIYFGFASPLGYHRADRITAGRNRTCVFSLRVQSKSQPETALVPNTKSMIGLPVWTVLISIPFACSRALVTASCNRRTRSAIVLRSFAGIAPENLMVCQ